MKAVPPKHRAAKRASGSLPSSVWRTVQDDFGIRRMREGQEVVIKRALAGEDTLAIMPTGAGKSLCYQVPALHLDGITLVVSPLIALMQDQVAKLADIGIAAEQFNSAVARADQEASLQRVAEGSSAIVFATPERLADSAFITTLAKRRIALFVVDEAHCISQWGHDFRPAFLEIGAAMKALGNPALLALTATAPSDVVDDIRRQLGRPRMQVVDTGLYRSNLRLQVVQCMSEGEKLDRTLEALGRARGPGIVYTATVKACTALHDALLARGESVTFYHGRLSKSARAENQERFMRGDARVMVATNAFGMGIDKPDLRFVLHYQMPGSLESYYQEAGRAGRDGEGADCALLFERRDRQVQQFFLARRYPTVEDLQRVHAALAESVEPLPIGDLAECLPGLSRQRTTVALQLLRDNRLARADRKRAWQATSGRVDPAVFERLAAEYEQRAERDHEALERMVFYAQTGFCRWRVVLEYFEEPLPFDRNRCGVCDNCLRMNAAPPVPIEIPAKEASGRCDEIRWRPEGEVRVPRYGTGRVAHASGEEVEVRFADGALRSFVASYVQPVETSRPGEVVATIPAGALASPAGEARAESHAGEGAGDVTERA